MVSFRPPYDPYLERYEVKHNVTNGDGRRTAVSNSNESRITVADATLYLLCFCLVAVVSRCFFSL